MPADEDTPRRRRVLSKDWMEGFSDGVYGFAATLLVLEGFISPLDLVEIGLMSAEEANEPHEMEATAAAS